MKKKPLTKSKVYALVNSGLGYPSNNIEVDELDAFSEACSMYSIHIWPDHYHVHEETNISWDRTWELFKKEYEDASAFVKQWSK